MSKQGGICVVDIDELFEKKHENDNLGDHPLIHTSMASKNYSCDICGRIILKGSFYVRKDYGAEYPKETKTEAPHRAFIPKKRTYYFCLNHAYKEFNKWVKEKNIQFGARGPQSFGT
jgi:hypothetical protein